MGSEHREAGLSAPQNRLAERFTLNTSPDKKTESVVAPQISRIIRYVLRDFMDWLTFIANLTKSLAWPIAVVASLLGFRTPIKNLILSVRHLRYKDLEIELVAPEEVSDQEIGTIVSYLQRSPHSFQWFRENTDFQYTDSDFEALIAKHPQLLERITIVSRDETKRKTTPGLRGLRLTPSGKNIIRNALQIRTT